MVIDLVAAVLAVGEWVPQLTAALRLGTAGLAFGIAVHHTVRYIRRNRERHRGSSSS